MHISVRLQMESVERNAGAQDFPFEGLVGVIF